MHGALAEVRYITGEQVARRLNEQKGSKIRPRNSSGIPGPESTIATRASAPMSRPIVDPGGECDGVLDQVADGNFDNVGSARTSTGAAGRVSADVLCWRAALARNSSLTASPTAPRSATAALLSGRASISLSCSSWPTMRTAALMSSRSSAAGCGSSSACRPRAQHVIGVRTVCGARRTRAGARQPAPAVRRRRDAANDPAAPRSASRVPEPQVERV